MAMIWAGIDAGKTHHHCVAIDESGRRLLSRRVANDEPELLELLADVLSLGDEVAWGIDLADDGAALAIAILFNHDQQVHYISGRAIHRAPESYRGEGKTDARDAAVIADQVRTRRDLHALRTGDETVTDLRILVGRRIDLVADRTRTVNRLRAQLTDIFPGLERALDLTNTGPLMLLTGYQTPASLRRTGKKRLETWLRNRRVLRADWLAETALEAAGRQHTSLPGEKLTAQLVHTLAAEVMSATHDATTADSNQSSTSTRCSASVTATTPAASTTANAPRASATSRPSLPWPAAASTSLGPPTRRTDLRGRASHHSRGLTDSITEVFGSSSGGDGS